MVRITMITIQKRLTNEYHIPSNENIGDVPDTLLATCALLSFRMSIFTPYRNQPRSIHWCSLQSKVYNIKQRLQSLHLFIGLPLPHTHIHVECHWKIAKFKHCTFYNVSDVIDLKWNIVTENRLWELTTSTKTTLHILHKYLAYQTYLP